jgi:hypothetical protein
VDDGSVQGLEGVGAPTSIQAQFRPMKYAVPNLAGEGTIAMAGRKPRNRIGRTPSGTMFVVCCALIFILIAVVAAYFLSRLF